MVNEKVETPELTGLSRVGISANKRYKRNPFFTDELSELALQPPGTRAETRQKGTQLRQDTPELPADYFAAFQQMLGRLYGIEKNKAAMRGLGFLMWKVRNVHDRNHTVHEGIPLNAEQLAMYAEWRAENPDLAKAFPIMSLGTWSDAARPALVRCGIIAMAHAPGVYYVNPQTPLNVNTWMSVHKTEIGRQTFRTNYQKTLRNF